MENSNTNPTAQLSFTLYELHNLEMHILKSHMFMCNTDEELLHAIENNPILKMLRPEKEILHRKLLDAILDMPNQKIRADMIKTFRESDKLRDDEVYVLNNLFSQQMELNKFRDIARYNIKKQMAALKRKFAKTIKLLPVKS